MKKAIINKPYEDSEFLCFTTTNKGGYSQGNYGELNLGAYCGEKIDIVRKNRSLVCSEVGVKGNLLFVPRETHQTESIIIDESFIQLSEEEQEQRMSNADALITSQPAIAIAISTADCVPVVIIDKKNKRTAAIHAGWRGIAAEIIIKTLDKMQTLQPMDRDQTIAIIGPCIGANSFEVDYDVWEQIAGVFTNPTSILKEKNDKKYKVDLRRAAEIQSNRYCGEIIISQEDTKTSNNYYSARRDGFATGRFLSGAVIKG